MKYKLLLLDIDGTLTASKADALPTPRVIAAVKQAQKQLHIAVATGRPKEFAQIVLDALDLHGYGIFNGGSEIINTVTHKIEFEQLLSVKQLKELVTIALPFGYKVYQNEDQYSTATRSPEEVNTPSAKLFIEAVKINDVPAMVEELNSVKHTLAHPTSSWEDGDVLDIHVTHELATKRHGAEELMKLLSCAKSEVIAVGDGYNDVPLMEAAGLKVAMGNSPDEVKAIADYIAPSLADDGVADVIERFILNG